MWKDKQIEEIPLGIPVLVKGKYFVYSEQIEKDFVALVEVDNNDYMMTVGYDTCGIGDWEFDFEDITHWMEVPEWH